MRLGTARRRPEYHPAMDTAIENPPADAELSDRVDRPEPEMVEPDLVEDELLVEEVSIDGMCGVY
jgi:mycofactocin precursor